MNQQTSPSTHERHGIMRMLQVWERPRSTFYWFAVITRQRIRSGTL